MSTACFNTGLYITCSSTVWLHCWLSSELIMPVLVDASVHPGWWSLFDTFVPAELPIGLHCTQSERSRLHDCIEARSRHLKQKFWLPYDLFYSLKQVAQLWQRDPAKLDTFSINVKRYSQNLALCCTFGPPYEGIKGNKRFIWQFKRLETLKQSFIEKMSVLLIKQRISVFSHPLGA